MPIFKLITDFLPHSLKVLPSIISEKTRELFVNISNDAEDYEARWKPDDFCNILGLIGEKCKVNFKGSFQTLKLNIHTGRLIDKI